MFSYLFSIWAKEWQWEREMTEWKRIPSTSHMFDFFIQFWNKFAFFFLYFLSYTWLISFRWLIPKIFIHKLVKVTKNICFCLIFFSFCLEIFFQFCTSLYDCKFVRKQTLKLSYEQVLSKIPDSTTESFIARLTWVLKPFCR